MEVTLLGTGDTTGTPTVGCACETCERARELDVERSRFSVHVRNPDTDESLLVDVSPDFRHQFLTRDVPLPDAAVVSHIHFDHLDGLGNAFRLFDDLPVYAADETEPTTGESVADTVRSKYDYLDRISVHGVTPESTIRVCGLDVSLVPVDHPPVRCYGLVVTDSRTGETLAMTGDTSFAIPATTRDALAGADLLLADAIVPAAFCRGHPLGGAHPDENGVPRSFGGKHMTREGALALADELEPEQVRLVHVAHFYPAEEAFEEPLAVDGERYEL